jgi:hypothetical protein
MSENIICPNIICPLTLTHRVFDDKSTVTSGELCRRTQCAWWVAWEKECAIKHIARSLSPDAR